MPDPEAPIFQRLEFFATTCIASMIENGHKLDISGCDFNYLVLTIDAEYYGTRCPNGYYKGGDGYCHRYEARPQCGYWHGHNYYHEHYSTRGGYSEWHTAWHCHSYWQ